MQTLWEFEDLVIVMMHKLVNEGVQECLRGKHGLSYRCLITDDNISSLVRSIDFSPQLAVFQGMVLSLIIYHELRDRS